ncbi:MAG: argininosuccinate lyase [Chitinophagales bacterium]|nr:argininosuccinate lyase [Chitinophagales bacterium]
MKIWKKDETDTSALVEQFTVGRDREFDLLLAKYDVLGSLAHTEMLSSVGLLLREDFGKIQAALKQILDEIECGDFSIVDDCEDIHSQIEWMLTQRIGDAGKKIHSGRSRNDQVAVDIKLFLKDAVQEIKRKTNQLFALLQSLSEQYKKVLMPGYTHLQVAMPSSFGLWLGAYAEALVDDVDMLAVAYRMADKNPLGSGAGYGSSFPLNRQMTTELLGFDDMHYNSVYAQMSRGKTEKTVAIAIAGIASTIAKLSMDMCLYNSQNFMFLTFPSSLTTGSSIMPHKKNPDVLELVRGKCNRLQSLPNELVLLMSNLPSGYHREMQLTKEILFPAIDTIKTCIDMVMLMLENMIVNEFVLDAEMYNNLFTVERLNDLVNAGMPFRDAYVLVGNEVNTGNFCYETSQLNHTHEGSIGNLCNDKIAERMDRVLEQFS